MVNTLAAIMAIPGPLEPIRLVGDEEKHATLLFLGETSTLPDTAKQTLLDAVEMASGMMFPFSESVVDVVRLGSEVPPALVAMLTGENLGLVRNLFMMNTDVNGFMGNVDQHPQFTPHVTLGHPDFTDEAILRALMRQVWRVRFDRLAVWWNDERIEFSLGPPQDNMAMSDAIDNFLAHDLIALEEVSEDDAEQHGVKGQKWGVRRSVDSSTGLVSGSSKLSLKRALGGKGSADGSGVSTGLKARTGSADQIAQDRIAKKIATVGTKSLSNADIQAYTRRLQLEKDLNSVLAAQSASAQKKADGFIKSFVKSQASRQTNRIANAAADIAVEKALEAAGIKIGKKGGNPDAADMLVKVSTRIKPKKK